MHRVYPLSELTPKDFGDEWRGAKKEAGKKKSAEEEAKEAKASPEKEEAPKAAVVHRVKHKKKLTDEAKVDVWHKL